MPEGQEWPKPAELPHLCHQLQVVDVVLLGDDELVDVALPLPLRGRQHVQEVQVCTPCKTQQHPGLDSRLCAERSRPVAVTAALSDQELLPVWSPNYCSHGTVPAMLHLSVTLNIPFNTFILFIKTKAVPECELLPGGQASKSPSPCLPIPNLTLEVPNPLGCVIPTPHGWLAMKKRGKNFMWCEENAETSQRELGKSCSDPLE